jgi:hypothetical protein
MKKLGYRPDKRLPIKVVTRDIPPFRDPAVILLDHLKEIYVDAYLEPVDTTQWFPRLNRKDYIVALNLTGNAIDEPDKTFTKTTFAAPRPTLTNTAIPSRQAGRSAIDGNRPEKTWGAGVGDRTKARRRRGAADNFLCPRRQLPTTLRQGADDHVEQHL